MPPASREWDPGWRSLSAARRQGGHPLHEGKKYTHLGWRNRRGSLQVAKENARLKWLVANPLLDKHTLSEALRRKV